MFHRIIAGLAVVVLAGAGLVATTAGAQAKSPRPTISAPSSVGAGQTFTITVRPHHQGKVALQRKAAGGHWRTVAHRRSHHTSGKLLFVRVEHTSGRVAYRAKVAHRHSKPDHVTVMAKAGTGGGGGGGTVTPPLAGPSLSVEVSSSADDIFVNDAYTVGIEAVQGDGSPIANLPVTVQRQDPGSSTWTALAPVTTGDNGQAEFTDSSSKRGIVGYRVSGGKLTGDTEVVVWENLTMPTSPGNGVSVKASACGSIAPSSDGVALRLISVAKGCQVRVGDSVTATWNFGGIGCVPVQYDDFWLDGTPGAKVTVNVEIDGADVSPDPNVLSVGDHAKGLDIDNSDPMNQLSIMMTASAGDGGTFVGDLVNPRATCF